jgi:hypothetical protein
MWNIALTQKHVYQTQNRDLATFLNAKMTRKMCRKVRITTKNTTFTLGPIRMSEKSTEHQSGDLQQKYRCLEGKCDE